MFGLRRRGEAVGLVCSAEEKQKPKSKEGGAPLLFLFGRVEKIRGESGGCRGGCSGRLAGDQ